MKNVTGVPPVTPQPGVRQGTQERKIASDISPMLITRRLQEAIERPHLEYFTHLWETEERGTTFAAQESAE
jgi:hypothetical protein